MHVGESIERGLLASVGVRRCESCGVVKALPGFPDHSGCRNRRKICDECDELRINLYNRQRNRRLGKVKRDPVLHPLRLAEPFKTCWRCERELPSVLFDVQSRSKLLPYCQQCAAEPAAYWLQEGLRKLCGNFQCTGCHEWKPRVKFYSKRDKNRGKFYRCAMCKMCHLTLTSSEEARARTQAWYERNRDQQLPKMRERTAAWLQAHPEYGKQYYRQNSERLRDTARQYYWVDPGARYAKQIAWRAKNPEKLREAARRNGNRRRARVIGTESPGVTTLEWAIICAIFDHRCAYCGCARPLTVDHVVPISRGGADAWDNVVPACKLCNCSKNNKLLSEWEGYYAALPLVA